MRGVGHARLDQPPRWYPLTAPRRQRERRSAARAKAEAVNGASCHHLEHASTGHAAVPCAASRHEGHCARQRPRPWIHTMIMVAAARGPCQCMRVCRVSIQSFQANRPVDWLVGWLSDRGEREVLGASPRTGAVYSSETAETAAACARIAPPTPHDVLAHGATA